MATTTWNPSDKGSNITLSNANLTATVTTTTVAPWVRAADKQVSGKAYWEYTVTTFAGGFSGVGISGPTVNLASGFAVATSVYTCAVIHNGPVYVDGSSAGNPNFGAIASGSVICIAFDAPNRLIWFRIGAAGNWNNSASANPATGTGGLTTSLGAGIPAYPAFFGAAVSEAVTANFGASAFTGTVPSGFTSGFTSGVTSPTNALATQAALEQWGNANPQGQVTQVALEMWASTGTVSGQALVTQVSLEMWAKVPIISGQARAMVMA